MTDEYIRTYMCYSGTLSDRMLVPGNMWQQAWQGANAVSAKQQKRLFNDTKEAEKVFFCFFTVVVYQDFNLFFYFPATFH